MFTRKEILIKLTSLDIKITTKTFQRWCEAGFISSFHYINDTDVSYDTAVINEVYATNKMFNGDIPVSPQMLKTIINGECKNSSYNELYKRYYKEAGKATPKKAKRNGPGRPPGTLRPTGKKLRSIRLTNEEYEQVKEFVKSLRS
ncbi:MAG: hypothetical protein H6Q74_2845 [Firmicutes bacterium]|nr:hypothetical protein [Bacillota bacterium]